MKTIIIKDIKFSISTDRTKIDIDKLHHYLSNVSYWAKSIPKSLVKTSIKNSLCFSIITGSDEFIGFARIITDKATFGYLADVYTDEKFRGIGLGKFLMKTIMEHQDLALIRNWFLYTKDAHNFYKQFNWQSLPFPERAMAISVPTKQIYDKIGKDNASA